MAVQIGWDEYEVALLIDACNKIRDNKIDKTECMPSMQANRFLSSIMTTQD